MMIWSLVAPVLACTAVGILLLILTLRNNYHKGIKGADRLRLVLHHSLSIFTITNSSRECCGDIA